MVKRVIDYATREIIFYRFVCNNPNIINTYCGSTIDFTKRKYKHKSHCNNENAKEYHFLIYKTIRNNGGWDNWKMLEIERKIVKDKTESLQREQYWIEYYNAQMNMNNAKKNENYDKEYNDNNKDKHKQYREQNRDKIKQYHKEYRQQNKDKVLQRDKKYREQNRDKITQYRKEYREQNIDKVLQLEKEYRDKNRDKKNEYGKEYRQRLKERKLMSLEDKNIM